MSSHGSEVFFRLGTADMSLTPSDTGVVSTGGDFLRPTGALRHDAESRTPPSVFPAHRNTAVRRSTTACVRVPADSGADSPRNAKLYKFDLDHCALPTSSAPPGGDLRYTRG
jgi:hypothetical protein